MSYHGICKKCGNNVRKWENVLDNFNLWAWSGKSLNPEKEFVWVCMGEDCDCYGFYEADNQPEWVNNIETISY